MWPKILSQTIKMQQRSLIFWTIGLLILIALYMLIYPSIKESAAELNAYMEKLPEAFRAAFIGEGAEYTSPIGYINSEIFTQMLPILFIFYAVGFGSGAIAGEEEKGTLDVLLSNPLRRSRVVIEKFGALLVGLAYLAIIVVVGLAIGTKFVQIDIEITKLLAVTFTLFLLATNFGTLSIFVGCLTGSRGLAIGLTTAVAIATFFINALSPIAAFLEKIRDFSPFFHYVNNTPIIHGVNWLSAFVLIWVTIGLLVLSIAAFANRDLNV